MSGKMGDLSERDERKISGLNRVKKNDIYNSMRKKWDINPVEKPHSPPKGKYQYDRIDEKNWKDHLDEIEDIDDQDFEIQDNEDNVGMSEEEIKRKLEEFNRTQKL